MLSCSKTRGSKGKWTVDNEWGVENVFVKTRRSMEPVRWNEWVRGGAVCLMNTLPGCSLRLEFTRAFRHPMHVHVVG